MLANSFECVGNINKLEIRQSSQTRKTYVYNDIRLRDIVEPAGMHIFSLYKDASNDPFVPLFIQDPKEHCLFGAAITRKEEVTYESEAITKANQNIRYLDKDILINPLSEYTAALKLADLQTKMHKSFPENLNRENQAGIVAICPAITKDYCIGFKLFNDKLSLPSEAKLVIKFIAKFPQEYSLKFFSDFNENVTTTSEQGFLNNKFNYVSEIQGTGEWSTYTFCINNSSGSHDLENLIFYIGLANNNTSTTTISVESEFGKFLYISYLEAIILSSEYKDLDYYNPMENVTTIKNGVVITNQVIEVKNMTQAQTKAIVDNLKHDIILTKRGEN